EAGVVAITEREQNLVGVSGAASAGCTEAARCGACGAGERIGRARRQLAFGIGGEPAPVFVQPAMHAELMAPVDDLTDGVGVMVAVPTLHEKAGARAAALEQCEDGGIADCEGWVVASRAVTTASADVCGLSHVVEGE